MTANMPVTITCPCQHCDGRIEFSSENFQTGMKHDCPHCGMETTLFIPHRMPPKPEMNLQPAPNPRADGSGLKPAGNWLLPLACWLAVLFLAANCVIGFLSLKRSHAAPQPQTWDYTEFTFDEEHGKPWLDSNDKDGWHRYRQTLVFYKFGGEKSYEVSSHSAYRIHDILDSIGSHGWELAWLDGTRYIVRRVRGHWNSDHFSITYKLDPEYKGPFKKD